MLFIGVALFFIELFFIPGTTVVGIVGILLAILGIFFAYTQHGSSAGHLSLVITLSLIIGLIIYGAKSDAWSKLANKNAITSKSNVIENESVKVGDTGICLSDIKPAGKARINNASFEVHSLGEFILHGKQIEVIKLSGNKIYVRELSEPDNKA